MAAKSKPATTRKTTQRIKIRAIEFTYNDQTMYLAAAPAATIFSSCSVSRAHEDPEKGYQRYLSPSRVKAIAAYIDEGHVIPGAVVLSAHEDVKLRFDSDTQMLSFSPVQGGFLIIDGQHRLYGAHQATLQIPVAVCILLGLKQPEEVQYFLDVNSNQKGVPRTLQLEIMKFLESTEPRDKVRIRLVNELNVRPDSPLIGKISPHKSTVGKLTHVPFQKALDPLLDVPPLRGAEFEGQVKLLINFLSALEQILIESLGDAAKLTNAAFLQAAFGAFREVVHKAKLEHGDLRVASLTDVMLPLKHIEWPLNSGTNKKAIAAFTQHILDLIGAEDRLTTDIL